MLALRRMTVEAELMKWMVLLFAAAVIALFLATRMAGADNAPGLLPDDMNTWARPMDETTAAPFFPEVGPPLRTNDLNQVLWRIIELHRHGQADAAIEAWRQANVPCETDGWKYMAMGAAHLQAGDIEEAEENLAAALEIDPNNAVTRYYVGLLRLTQAKGAWNWQDAVGPPAVMLIAMPAIVPNTRAMYELAAMQELEKAIELAPMTDLAAPLTAEAWDAATMLPLVTPTAGDLVEALGADRYAARAHNVLGAMYTDRGLFEEAEEHIDAATADGMNAPFAYRDLGKALGAEERYEDAARVFLKAFRHGDANLIPALKAFENAWKAARGG